MLKKEHPGRTGRVIFNVFKDIDKELYERELEGGVL